MTTSISTPTPAARTIYILDAVASAGLGIVLAVFAAPLTAIAGWALPVDLLFWLGLILVPWGVFNYWSGRAASLPGWAFATHMTVDGLWVLGSLVLLILEAGRLTPLGMVLLIGQAVLVLGVLILKRRTR